MAAAVKLTTGPAASCSSRCRRGQGAAAGDKWSAYERPPSTAAFQRLTWAARAVATPSSTSSACTLQSEGGQPACIAGLAWSGLKAITGRLGLKCGPIQSALRLAALPAAWRVTPLPSHSALHGSITSAHSILQGLLQPGLGVPLPAPPAHSCGRAVCGARPVRRRIRAGEARRKRGLPQRGRSELHVGGGKMGAFWQLEPPQRQRSDGSGRTMTWLRSSLSGPPHLAPPLFMRDSLCVCVCVCARARLPSQAHWTATTVRCSSTTRVPAATSCPRSVNCWRPISGCGAPSTTSTSCTPRTSASSGAVLGMGRAGQDCMGHEFGCSGPG